MCFSASSLKQSLESRFFCRSLLCLRILPLRLGGCDFLGLATGVLSRPVTMRANGESARVSQSPIRAVLDEIDLLALRGDFDPETAKLSVPMDDVLRPRLQPVHVRLCDQA